MSALIVLFLLPLLWSGVVAAIRWLLRCSKQSLDDAGEKAMLAIVLAPILLGAAIFAFWRLTPLHWTLPAIPTLQATGAPPDAAATPYIAPSASPQLNLLAWVLPALWTIYGVGLLWNVAALLLAFLRLRRIMSTATSTVLGGTTVHLTRAPISPLAFGRATIVLPTSLATSLDTGDLKLLLAHERAHLDRRDPLYFALLSWIEAVFWFNPFVLAQTRHCRTAAEIVCDRVVTPSGSPEREAYARLLVATLRTLNEAVEDSHRFAPAVFAPERIDGYRQRLHAILHSDEPRPRRVLYAALAVAALPLLFAQVAYSQNPPPKADNSPGPVAALDAGKVIRVAPHQRWYGVKPDGSRVSGEATYISIDHGGGVTGEYAVAGESTIKVGDAIAAGQVLGQVQVAGESAWRVHLKVSKDGKNIECMLGPRNTCFFQTHNSSGLEDAGVYWDGAALVLPDRTLYADLILEKPSQGIVIGEGHVRIVDEDNSAKFQQLYDQAAATPNP